jgi:exosortase
MEAEASAQGRLSLGRSELAWLALIAALAVVLCVPAARGLAYLFGRLEFYAHGYLVPVVAVYLAFTRRDEIRAALVDLEPPALGPLVVLAAASFEVLVVMGNAGFLAGVGIPLVLGATAWAVGGDRLLKPLGLSLVFLALMVPPPGFVTQDLLARLKLIVTNISVEILYRAGHSVYAEGNRIEIPGHTLFVADACSGLTAIITLLPVGCVIAFFLSRGWWRRLFVVASVVPLAMAANVVRVVVTVELVDTIGIQAAEGFLHESFGILTYVVGTLFLVAFARVLR